MTNAHSRRVEKRGLDPEKELRRNGKFLKQSSNPGEENIYTTWNPETGYGIVQAPNMREADIQARAFGSRVVEGLPQTRKRAQGQ